MSCPFCGQFITHTDTPGCIVHSVTCLAADTCLTADPEVGSLIRAWSHSFVEVDHEIILMVILLLPLIQEGLLSVISERMSMQYWSTA